MKTGMEKQERKYKNKEGEKKEIFAKGNISGIQILRSSDGILNYNKRVSQEKDPAKASLPFSPRSIELKK
jgi:hypothetical protein